MKLTRTQRAALVKGEHPPKITFPGDKPCPVQPGHVEVLSVHVWFEVTDILKNKAGDWSLRYTLYNNRLGQRYLAAQDGQVHPEQYNHSGGSSVDYEAGEAVDEFTQRRITQEARERERAAIGELLVAAEDFRSALSERIESNPDFMKIAGRDVWLVRSKIDRWIRNVRRKAA